MGVLTRWQCQVCGSLASLGYGFVARSIPVPDVGVEWFRAEDGHVWGWGDNRYAQLGPVATAEWPTPASLTDIPAEFCGALHGQRAVSVHAGTTVSLVVTGLRSNPLHFSFPHGSVIDNPAVKYIYGASLSLSVCILCVCMCAYKYMYICIFVRVYVCVFA